MELLTFKPLYMERVWGGRGLTTKLGRELPEGKVIGESWELVDREEAQSTVAAGPHAGKSIRELLENFAADILGPKCDGLRPFPILIKWLDCKKRLSLQVHPPSEIATKKGIQPKTENWYIAECEADASLILGLKNGITREQFSNALAESRVEECVHKFRSQVGDSILVESGRMHAIDAGNLILEVQQNSDTTFRVYDWDRVDLDGNPRKLHVEESLKSIDFEDFEPEPIRAIAGTQTLADCAEFRIRKFELDPSSEPFVLSAAECARLLHLVSGKLVDSVSGVELTRGNNYLQPYITGVSLKALEPTTLLITDRF